jgi:hypothetical protein
MDSPWWSSGLFTLLGAALIQLFNTFNAKRDRQFRLEDRESDQRSRLNDLRREAYSRFITQCRKVQVTPSLDEKTLLWQFSSDIRILGTRAVSQRANLIVDKIAELPTVTQRGKKQIEELGRQTEVTQESAHIEQVMVIPEVRKYIEVSQLVNSAIDDFSRAVKAELAYPD